MSNKEYIFTTHVKSRMLMRGISEDEVEETIKNPGITYPGKHGETNAVKTVLPGKKIRVVYKTERNKKIIITAVVCD